MGNDLLCRKELILEEVEDREVHTSEEIHRRFS